MYTAIITVNHRYTAEGTADSKEAAKTAAMSNFLESGFGTVGNVDIYVVDNRTL